MNHIPDCSTATPSAGEADPSPAPGEPGTARVAGHFGEWLQGRHGPTGPVVLVTALCPDLHVEARWEPGDGAGGLVLEATPPSLLEADRLAAFLARLGRPATGRFTVVSPMVPGSGSGSSTAALVAVARALDGGATPPEVLARACLRVEGATDPLMLPRPDTVIWASREARVVERVPAPPEAEIVGGLFGSPLKTDPEDVDFPNITDLIIPWCRACADHDLAAAAAVASQSAERTTVWRGPARDPMAELAAETGALGHLRAHTGALRGLIFAPGKVPAGVAARLEAAGIRSPMRFRTAPAPRPTGT